MRFWGKKREEPFRGEVTLYRGVFRTEEQRDDFADRSGEAIARQKGAHLTVTAVPCAALTLDRAEALHGGALELAWGEIAEG